MSGQDPVVEEERPDGKYPEVPVTALEPNAHNPRKTFKPAQLEDLAASIKNHGVLQPIRVCVHPTRPNRYVIIAGERRWRASIQAGKATIPALIVPPVEGAELREVQLDENGHRVQLSPLEEAVTYADLQQNYGYTIEMLTGRARRSPTYVRDRLSLLSLALPVQEMVDGGELRLGAALALCGIKEEAVQERFARESVAAGMTVSQTEQLVKQYKQEKRLQTLRFRRQERLNQRFEELAKSGPVVTPETYNPQQHHEEWLLRFPECRTCALKGSLLRANGRVQKVCVLPDCYYTLQSRDVDPRDLALRQQRQERREAFCLLDSAKAPTRELLKYLLWERIYHLGQPSDNHTRERIGLPPYDPAFAARSREWDLLYEWSEERLLSSLLYLCGVSLKLLSNEVLATGLKMSLVTHFGLPPHVLGLQEIVAQEACSQEDRVDRLDGGSA